MQQSGHQLVFGTPKTLSMKSNTWIFLKLAKFYGHVEMLTKQIQNMNDVFFY